MIPLSGGKGRLGKLPWGAGVRIRTSAVRHRATGGAEP